MTACHCGDPRAARATSTLSNHNSPSPAYGAESLHVPFHPRNSRPKALPSSPKDPQTPPPDPAPHSRQSRLSHPARGRPTSARGSGSWPRLSRCLVRCSAFDQVLLKNIARGSALVVRDEHGAVAGGLLLAGDAHEGRVTWLAVRRECRRHGIGESLVREALRRLRGVSHSLGGELRRRYAGGAGCAVVVRAPRLFCRRDGRRRSRRWVTTTLHARPSQVCSRLDERLAIPGTDRQRDVLLSEQAIGRDV